MPAVEVAGMESMSWSPSGLERSGITDKQALRLSWELSHVGPPQDAERPRPVYVPPMSAAFVEKEVDRLIRLYNDQRRA